MPLKSVCLLAEFESNLSSSEAPPLTPHSLLGLSALFALLADAITFSTMHVYWLYHAIEKACRLQLGGIASLWLLFRGKKRNVLKNRIDSQDYDFDQLLLGTLLFCTIVIRPELIYIIIIV